MSQKISPLLKINQRCIFLNSPCTSTSAPYIDYSFSNEILKDSLPKVDFHCHNFIANLNEDLKKVQLIEKKINTVRYDIRKCFSNADIRFVPIGSAANRLLSNYSDLDLVLLPSNNIKEWKSFMKKFSSSERFRNSYMRNVHAQLVAGRIGIVREPFLNARIPIIQIHSKNRLQVDIQFGNIGPIRSSLFVRTCVEYDERVRLLMHWLTNKFQEAGILNSRIGLFSKYHTNTLVIHFLQAIPYPVLPDIMKLSSWLSTKNDWNNAVKVLTRQGSLYVPNCSETPNEQSVGALAVQLIDYYSQIDFRRFAIDTRGNLSERTDNDPLHIKIVDEYFDHSTCNVMEAPRRLTQLFSELKSNIKETNYTKIFNYHIRQKHIPEKRVNK